MGFENHLRKFQFSKIIDVFSILTISTIVSRISYVEMP